MADNIFMPSGSGGLMRYNEEYKSSFMLSPNQVVIFIAVVIIGMAVLKIMF